MGLIRGLLALALCFSFSIEAQHASVHGGFHDVHRAVGTVQAPAARLREEDWHPGARWFALARGSRSTWATPATRTSCAPVHARQLEEKFVAEGYGVKRFEVMYNDFIWSAEIGPGKVGAAGTS